ncbi:aminotransferase class I/II-fold pyridoxal phosphate-dependent enzyme [Actinomadura geliboluensis]|uniref:aminotransferase class I/II-fold pyridoxal phosphate-dependent enzyme n=1 Tax=Actinomadura geliboluensis TaxID=882440 RepID=UPI00371C8AE7
MHDAGSAAAGPPDAVVREGLFAEAPALSPPPGDQAAMLPSWAAVPSSWSPGQDAPLDPQPDQALLEVFERACDPTDPIELRDLYLGWTEARLGRRALRPELAERWRAARRRRTISADEVLSSQATARWVKELFNTFFRDEVYGALRSPANLILSGGAVDAETWGLPSALKQCVHYALDRDWYGYSDTRGRETARAAIAAYETARITGATYEVGNVAITMGGTFTIGCLADIAMGRQSSAPALCAIPNYPPLVASVARRGPIRLVPTPICGGRTRLQPLIDQVRADTPLILLQTVTNPTGTAVAEPELAALIRRTSPTTLIVLDECHEWLGAPRLAASERAAANVVRVSSLAKNWSAPGLKAGWILAAAPFITDYYRYASTTYGDPASLFYSLVETLARMERWRLEDTTGLRAAHLAEFEDSYGLTLSRLQIAYTGYRGQREARERDLHALRRTCIRALQTPRSAVTVPRYSINTSVSVTGYDTSHLAFRDLLAREQVAVYPGILAFCLSGAPVRITSALPWQTLVPALERLTAALAP